MHPGFSAHKTALQSRASLIVDSLNETDSSWKALLREMEGRKPSSGSLWRGELRRCRWKNGMLGPSLSPLYSLRQFISTKRVKEECEGEIHIYGDRSWAHRSRKKNTKEVISGFNKQSWSKQSGVQAYKSDHKTLKRWLLLLSHCVRLSCNGHSRELCVSEDLFTWAGSISQKWLIDA